MPVARPERQEPRVIAHVDMDCFYVQVEQRRNPELKGLPTAVVQYNSWKGGGLIAVSYEARKFGIKRSMRGDEAKNVCPEINLVQVPVARGKADLNLYRNAGSEVVAILSTKGKCERASIDEVYLDLTESAKSMLLEASSDFSDLISQEVLKSHILGLDMDEEREREERVREWMCRNEAEYEDKLLTCGAVIVSELRESVLQQTQFTCSAGIAHNKMLAKLASGMNKPAQQTVVPTSCVSNLLASLPVKKMKQLGGKLGSSLQEDLGINTVGDLLQFSEHKLQDYYGINTGTWLWKICRGINGEEVENRILPKSQACGKTFPGPMALKNIISVRKWLDQLCEELSERIQLDLDQNKRIFHTLTLHARAFKENDLDLQRKFPSKSCNLQYGTSKIQEDAIRLFESGLSEFLSSQNVAWKISSLSVCASKISAIPNGTSSILKYFNGKCVKESNYASDLISETESGSNYEQCEDSSEIKEEEIICNKAPEENTNHGKGLLDKTPTNSKGTILSYFSGVSSSTNQVQNQQIINEPSTSNPTPNSNHNPNSMMNNWSFNLEEIDQSVVDELPPEIQREIQGWIHPSKRINTTKKAYDISRYFSPAKK
ncbi:hypothetical protein LUZ60_005445 [Juncus effusus]|nr:hypothetical protein LUZ60_005445 [Juncus effusus]